VTLLNDFIGVRGRSGSSRGARLIEEALAGVNVRTVSPRAEPTSKIARVANMLAWDFLRVPVSAARCGEKVIVHATNTGGKLRSQRSIVVMHDTMVLDHERLFAKVFVAYARTTFGVSARLADVIVTPSAHSASQIAKRWPRADIRVIPWPAPPIREDPRPGAHRAGFLMVASGDRHKRIPMAIEVVARLRRKLEQDFALNLVLRPGNDTEAINRALREWDSGNDWVKLHEDVSATELDHLYDTSFALIVASVDEGYCLPAVEAAAAGLPVAHTGRGSLNEVTAVTITPSQTLSQDASLLMTQLEDLVVDPQTWQSSARDGLALAASRPASQFRSSWSALIGEFS